jgi:hypothetical protein
LNALSAEQTGGEPIEMNVGMNAGLFQNTKIAYLLPD